MSPQSRTVRGSVVGVPLDPVTAPELVRLVLSWTDEPGTHLAVGVNAHVCNLAAADARFRERMLAADLCYADGQSVVWAGRILGVPVPERVATTDLVLPLVAECARQGKRVYLYGAEPGVADTAAAHLISGAPALQVATSHGFVEEQRMNEVIDSIRSHRTDVLLVGLGDPLQQEWIAAHRDELGVPVILSCGGLFDWTSGRHRRAPAWMISAGLEWLWRLLIEPRRLARRYLLGNPAFVASVARQFVSRRIRRRA
jgi:N-acetylglucosaminyldiphosphoundecaprenol N-acetyl-beta-D-mannosaminyltransferase